MTQQLELAGGANIELLERDGEFLGLGDISVGGIALRNGQRPLTVRLDTPQGILYTRLLIDSIEADAKGIRIALQCVGTPWARGEYLDDYGQSIHWLDQGHEPVFDSLSLLLSPASLELGGLQWNGFSYAFEFSSEVRSIHRLLTHATWEIGGSITGNTLLSQGQCNRPVYAGAVDSLFTTACLRTLDAYGSPQANSFQLVPRCGLMQGFDFQYAAEGALLGYWPQFDAISSLVESPPGAEILHIIDEYRFDLSRQVKTTPKNILFAPCALAEHEARNLWYAAIEKIYGAIRQQHNIVRSVAQPCVMPRYVATLEPASAQTGSDTPMLRIKVGDVETEHSRMLYALADHVVPRLVEQGITRYFPEVISESDVTQYGLKRKLDDGLHGDLHCASVCATHRFLPAEFWGGMKAWRYFYNKAHSAGLSLGHWFAPHFSPRSPLYREHPEYRMIDATGMPAGGGYGFETLVVADWNTDIYQRTFDDMKRWHDEGGLDYLFVDSYSNMGMLQLNYSQAMRNNYAAFAHLLSDLQGIGIASFTFESISPFGINQFGLVDLGGDVKAQDRSVAGQNDFGWWVGHEDMAIDCSFVANNCRRSERELAEILFRFMANRGYVDIAAHNDARHIIPHWWARSNKIYNLVVPHMQSRDLLPGRQGVRWTDGDGTTLLWLFADMTPPSHEVRRLERVTEDGFISIDPETSPLAAWQVYRLAPR